MLAVAVARWFLRYANGEARRQTDMRKTLIAVLRKLSSSVRFLGRIARIALIRYTSTWVSQVPLPVSVPLSVRVVLTPASPRKTAAPIEMPLGAHSRGLT